MLDKLIAEALQGMTGGGARQSGGGGRSSSPMMQILLQLLAGGIGGRARPGAGGGGLGDLLSGLAGGARGGGMPGAGSMPGAGGNPLEQLAGMILGGGGAGGGGGLRDLLSQLQGGGLGREADSWVSRGENLPVAPAQIDQAFGRERLGELAAQHGMSVDELTSGLATELPQAVDQLTPDGHVPEMGELAGLLERLTGGQSTTT